MFREIPPDILRTLLIDRTRTHNKNIHNIIWATSEYAGHLANSEIQLKDLYVDEIFEILENSTPSDTIEYMNHLIDQHSINYLADQNNWRDYVRELRLEITCGLAPFIVDRRNLQLQQRIGFLDRKMQAVSDFCHSSEEWLKWVKVAYKSSYGYELRGDYLICARVNSWKSFIDYWNDIFPNDKISLTEKLSRKHHEVLQNIAEIISWNIFQMDGMKYTLPLSCRKDCPGCQKRNAKEHNGIYAKIMDWQNKEVKKFVDLLD